MPNTLDLAKELISRPSVTPDDQGCQQLIADYLQPLGFNIEHMRFGEVDNLWARYGNEGPLFVFAGHTDVVPTGPEEKWTFPPFKPTIAGNTLYGRGSADMKSSIAAMMVACKALLSSGTPVKGSIGFLITSDEEGPATDGTVRVIETLEARNEKINWCLVGEPSSSKNIGDIIKNGRRGSISGKLIIHGHQGHIAYPHLADNPIHKFAPVLNELVSEHWDHGNDFFPPTSFQISNINAGTGATNVIPGELEVQFNLRFSTELKHTEIQTRIESILNKYKLEYTLDWSLSGQPFLTPDGNLISAARRAIKNICGIQTELSTSGGTSDGRFIAPTGAQVVELGPINESIHKIDENVSITDLEKLTKIYKRILIELVT
ncbi:MAG: succinyl-diaminopimelate desuccinylase [Gammaproteobacteria bacterium]|nr:succinyl-diaminopimelate desuccinylase [Gammaproteobacteria bacterium]MCW8924103.1 succinyl-diaminopimelate desuccinylase [Gammaproteobacteria bacterium]